MMRPKARTALLLYSLAAGAAVLWLVSQLPATMVSRWVGQASHQQVQLSHAQGTLWNGSAMLALIGPSGTGLSLPQRVQWRLGMQLDAWRPQLRLELMAQCCMQQAAQLTIGRMPGFLGAGLQLPASQWPLKALQGLGSPWNSMKLVGQLNVQPTQWLLNLSGNTLAGEVRAEINQLEVAMAPGLALGPFELRVGAPDAKPLDVGEPIVLKTLHGPLLLEGTGQWSPKGVSFKGTAHAEPDSKDRLLGLLTLLGEPQGDKHRLAWTQGS